MNRPLKEGNEAELACSVVGQSPTTRANHGASEGHSFTLKEDTGTDDDQGG